MNRSRIAHDLAVALALLLAVAGVLAFELRRRHVVISRDETSVCVLCRSHQYREVRWGVETRRDVSPSDFSRWVDQSYGAHVHSWVGVSDRLQTFLRPYAICGDANYIPIDFIPEEAHRRLLLSGRPDRIEAFHAAVRDWDTFPQAAELAGLEWRDLPVPEVVRR